ncbi:MAG: hypothetical protein E7559_10340 [Ruminococcaceae bacterium]|nr:hypothetical protein [Oscillospiraceae bacterium]
MLTSFREKIMRFFAGRYGYDQLSRAIVILAAVISFANVFVTNVWWSLGLGFAAVALMVLAILRTISRDISARSLENSRYLPIENAVVGFFRLQHKRIKGRKTECYRRCPNCRKTFRLPRNKGKHTARCPMCKHEFKVTIR